MIKNGKTSASPPASSEAPGWQHADEDKGSPPDKSGGERAAKRQKGQPGLPVNRRKDWSPGSDLEKQRI